MNEATLPHSLPDYSHPKGPATITAEQQKPLMKMLGKMMAKRLKLPHGKVASQTIKMKHKKVRYY
jgi:hypothetical protein